MTADPHEEALATEEAGTAALADIEAQAEREQYAAEQARYEEQFDAYVLDNLADRLADFVVGNGFGFYAGHHDEDGDIELDVDAEAELDASGPGEPVPYVRFTIGGRPYVAVLHAGDTPPAPPWPLTSIDELDRTLGALSITTGLSAEQMTSTVGAITRLLDELSTIRKAAR